MARLLTSAKWIPLSEMPTPRLTNVLLYVLAASMFAGCTEGDDEKRPPRTSLTIVNAAPGFENLSIRRGTSSAAEIGSLVYTERTISRLDSGSYNFTVETFDSPSQTVIERATFTEDLASGQKHFFVLTEQSQSVVPLIFSRPESSVTSADFELHIVNAVESVANVDFYVLPTGTDFSTVAPSGSAPYGELVSVGALQPGNYEFTLTEAGNPSTVLFASNEIAFAAGQSVEIAIVPDRNGIADRLTLLGATASNSFTLLDSTTPIAARFVNGGADQLARDFYLNGDFAAPFDGNVPFGVVGDFAPLPDGTTRITVTPAGNPSVVEAELVDVLIPGALHNVLVAGPAGDIRAVAFLDDRLRNNAHGRLLFFNTVSTYEALNIFVVEPGTDVTTVAPNLALVTLQPDVRTLIGSGTYELTVADAVSGNIVLGAQTITITAGGLFTVLLLDSGDGTTVNATLLDDF
jgi:hypothetical protein